VRNEKQISIRIVESLQQLKHKTKSQGGGLNLIKVCREKSMHSTSRKEWDSILRALIRIFGHKCTYAQ